ncbi:hypothetical protein RRG08_029075 [Elysia crispata]|uniref:Uncharacterized protein n=1 Tax=Elysia crispata TaxID=231223 RepID=A0AAE1DIG2_9GAST|nr:hypothetical protein RRG08_029075 [Elysia crispata]
MEDGQHKGCGEGGLARGKVQRALVARPNGAIHLPEAVVRVASPGERSRELWLLDLTAPSIYPRLWRKVQKALVARPNGAIHLPEAVVRGVSPGERSRELWLLDLTAPSIYPRLW